MVRKNFPLLDVLKFCLAILVVGLHTDPFLSYSSIIQTGFRSVLSTIAIPTFFIVSSFLFYHKINMFREQNDVSGEKKYFKKYCLRLLIIYLFWSAIYFPFVVINWIKMDNFTFIEILKYVRDFIFSGSYQTLWFLPALLTATILTYFLTKKVKKDTVILIIPGIFYLICAACTTYYGLFERISFFKQIIDFCDNTFAGFKNGLLFAFLPVTLGYFLNKKIQTNSLPSLKKQGILLLMFFIILVAEAFGGTFLGFAKNGVDQWIFLIPTCYFITSICCSIETDAFSNTIFIRKMSILIFLTQRIPLTIFSYLGYGVIDNSFVYFLVILACTSLLSFTYIKLSNKYRFFARFY